MPPAPTVKATKKKTTKKEEVVQEQKEEEPATIKPADQLVLTEKELDEDVARVITAGNPQSAHGVILFNFVEKEYKPIPGTADESVTFHLARTGVRLHNESEDAGDQKAYERNYRQMADDRRRQRIMQMQEEGKEVSYLAGADQGLDDDSENQRNQFNFTERAAQTFNNTTKTRVISTTPPDSATTSGTMTQWALYDAYFAEYERMVYSLNMENASKAAKAGKGDSKGRGGDSSDPLHSPAMARTLTVLERMANANAEGEIYNDFAFWEDASDAFREASGTCLPLWKFEDSRTKRKMVTAVAWNPAHPDMFVVAYGSYDFMKQGSGLLCVFSLKNVGHPEYTFSTESGVLCLDWHPTHSPLLAVGCYDGTVKVFDVRKKENKHIFASDIKSGKHTDPVWEVHWAPDDGRTTDLSFYSISSDGRIAAWFLTKSELKMEVIMALKLMPTVPPALAAGPSAATVPSVEGGASVEVVDDARAGGLAGGCCFAFNPFFPSQMLLGTEEGRIHAMSLDYAGQYSGTYEGHHMAVYAIVWNPFHPRVFASSSADWTVRLWDSTCPTSFMVFDLGTSVGDVRWAPYSSTVLAAVTDEGKVAVWDLSTSKHEAACEQKVVKKAKCTHLAFSALAPVIIVGDSTGGVTSLKLSPNLRRVSPIPAPVIKKGEPPAPPMSRLEVEIRKLDALLLASDARISIVTPVPGAEKKGAVAVVEAAVEEE